MTTSLFSSAAAEANVIPVGELPTFMSSYENDFQTGVVEVDFRNHARYHLLFARGELINVYRHAGSVERLDPAAWFQTLDTSREKAHLRSLALTPQAVRLIKILLEQDDVPSFPLPADADLAEQFEAWSKHPVPALAHIRWPGAEALALLPGDGSPPRYTLFVSANQILHSAGGMMAFYGWKEPCSALSLLSSETHTLAWDEYLLHYSFLWTTGHLLGRFIELAGPTAAHGIVEEINFACAAHGWKISIAGTSAADQIIFSSPDEAADVYSRLFEILFRSIERHIGADLLALLLRESVLRLPKSCQSVLQEYLLITPV